MGCNSSRHDVLHETSRKENVLKKSAPELTVTKLQQEVPLDMLASLVGDYDSASPLCVLRLEGVLLGESGGLRLGMAIGRGRHAQHLTSLRIAWCGIGSTGCASVADNVLAPSASLTSLDLEGNGVRAEGIKRLSSAINRRVTWGAPGSVFELRLSENPIVGIPESEGAEALAELVESLRRNVPRRKRILLSQVGLKLSPSRANARLITAALCAGRFDFIDLRHNFICEAGATMLAEALLAARAPKSRRSFLQQGDLEETPVSKLVAALRKESSDANNDRRVSSADERCGTVYEAALRLDIAHPLTAIQPPFAAFDTVKHSAVKRWAVTRMSIAKASTDLASASPRQQTPALTELSLRQFARDYDLFTDDDRQQQHIDVVKFRLFTSLLADLVAGDACDISSLDIRGNPCAATHLQRAWPLIRVVRAAEASRLGVEANDQQLLVESSQALNDLPVPPPTSRVSRRRRVQKEPQTTSSNPVEPNVGETTRRENTTQETECRSKATAEDSKPKVVETTLAQIDKNRPQASPTESNSSSPIVPKPDVTPSSPEEEGDDTQYWLLEASSDTSSSQLETIVDGVVEGLGISENEIFFRLETIDRSVSLLVAQGPKSFAWDWLDEELVQQLSIAASTALNSACWVSRNTAANLLRKKEIRLIDSLTSPTNDDDDGESDGCEVKQGVEDEKTERDPPRNQATVVTVAVSKKKADCLSAGTVRIARLLATYSAAGNDLKTAFYQFDSSRDGELSVTELLRGLSTLGPLFENVARADVEQVVAEIGEDSHLSYDAFEDLVSKHEALPRLDHTSLKVCRLLIIFVDAGSDLLEAFTSFDTSGDGSLSVAELLQGLRGLGSPFDQLERTDVESVVASILPDNGNDNHVTFDDLRAFVSRGRSQLAEKEEQRSLSKHQSKGDELDLRLDDFE